MPAFNPGKERSRANKWWYFCFPIDVTMSEGGTAEAGQGSSSNPSSHLPWHLIPSFDPGETDLTEYSRRLEFLAGIWPQEQLSQLAPRAALQCKGSAFQKVVRIAPEKLKVPSVEGVKLLVTTLGGVWGRRRWKIALRSLRRPFLDSRRDRMRAMSLMLLAMTFFSRIW